MEFPSVSMIVSNYNGMAYGILEVTLRSVLDLDYPNYEVLLVDNSSSDDSVETVQVKFGRDSRLRVVRNGVNCYSAGLNLGIASSHGKYVVFLNNDILLDKRYLLDLVELMESNPSIALATGKVLNYFRPGIIDRCGETIDIFGNPISIGAGELDLNQYGEMEVLSVQGSASIARKSIFSEIGEFDPAFHIGYEDTDVALRARLAGHKVFYIPKALSYHMHGATTLRPELKSEIRFHFNKNRIVTLMKNLEARTLILVLPSNVVLYLVASLSELFIKHNRRAALSRISALLWVLRNLRKVRKERTTVQNRIRKVSDRQLRALMPKTDFKKLAKSFFESPF